MPSLSQKYRPDHFSTITGQTHITETLRREVETGKLGHAFLFCGPRGVGKTTTARVLAKALLCLTPKLGEPCNECASCLAFNQNKHLDVIELDAATHTGVDNVREAIIEAVKYAPTLSKRKVYILDEVHMFSTSSWNALLKTLEEPPAHAFFILATTEWHKVPATIVSRCQRFEFKRIPDPILRERVSELAKQEGWQLDPSVATLIVSRSEGCVRDAETLLGQLGALGEKIITLDLASLVIPPSHLPLAISLMKLWGERKHAEALSEAKRLFEEGIALLPLFDDLLQIARLLLAASGDATLVSRWQEGTDEEKQLAGIHNFFTPGELHDLSLMLLERRKDAKSGLDPLFALELASTIVACGLLRHGPKAAVPMAPSESVQATRQPSPPIATVVAAASKPEDLEPRYEELPPYNEATIEPAAAAPIPSPVTSNPSPNPSVTIDLIRGKWPAIVRAIEEKNHSLPFILKLSRPDSLMGNKLTIRFQYPFHRDKILEDPKHRQLVEQGLQEVLGMSFALDGIIGNEVAAASAVPTTSGNPDMVSAILQAFGGQVVE